MKLFILILLIMTFFRVSNAQSSGIVEAYYDVSDKSEWFTFGHYQPLKDSTVEWSSYSWLHNKEILSRQWFQYWVTPKFGVGLEIEMWYTYNRDYYHDERWKPFKVYVIPRVGVQYRLW